MATPIDLDLGIPGKCLWVSKGVCKRPPHDFGLKRCLLFKLMSADMKNNIYSNNIMSIRNELVRRLLSGITMSELQNLVKLREEDSRPIPAPRRRTPIPAPRRNVRQLKQYFEDNPVPTYRPIPAPKQRNNNDQY